MFTVLCWRQGQHHKVTTSAKRKSRTCWYVSRRHLPPGGRVGFTLRRDGSQGDLREEASHPRKPHAQPSCLVLIQRGPLKSPLSLSPTYGKIETQRRQVNYSAFHVKSVLEAISLYPWKNRQSLNEMRKKVEVPPASKILYFSVVWHRL